MYHSVHRKIQPTDISKLFDITTNTLPEIKQQHNTEKIILDLNSLDIINEFPQIYESKKLSWKYTRDRNFTLGTFTTSTEVKNIIGMQLHFLHTNVAYNDSYFYTDQRVNVLVEEFRAQAFILKDRRYHFHSIRETYEPSYTSGYSPHELEMLNQGYFWFNKPITELTGLTLSFSYPYAVEAPPIDIKKITVNSFVFGATTTIPVYGLLNDVIYIKGFTTSDPTGDAVKIAEINRSSGHVVTATGANTITIAVDTSSLLGVQPNAYVYVYNSSSQFIGELSLFYQL